MQRSIIGLTLIEVLIALAVVAIAFGAIMHANSESITGTKHVEDKMQSYWVAENVLTSVRVGLTILPKGDREGATGSTEILGHAWYWRAEANSTPNPAIQAINVTVFPDEAAMNEDAQSFSLTGYQRVESKDAN